MYFYIILFGLCTYTVGREILRWRNCRVAHFVKRAGGTYGALGWVTSTLRTLKIKGGSTEGNVLLDHRAATHGEG